jgi:hypothetical protein
MEEGHGIPSAPSSEGWLAGGSDGVPDRVPRGSARGEDLDLELRSADRRWHLVGVVAKREGWLSGDGGHEGCY